MRVLKFFRATAGILIPVLFLSSCKQRVRVLKSPPNYNFGFAATDKLDARLQKISGMTWDSRNNVFLAVNEGGDTLYMLDRTSRSISEVYSIGNKGDYEDVTLYGGAAYILRSDGMLTRFSKDSTGNVVIKKLGEISMEGPNVFEAIYADTARKALVLICKTCKADDDKTVSAYAYYPDSTGFDTKPIYKIDADEVRKLSPFKSVKFQPSAAAINPVLRKLFILSAESRQLVIAGLDGKVDSVYKLSSKLFPSPKSISFNKGGEMYITNQGGAAKPTLIITSYKDSATVNGSKNKQSLAYDFSKPDEKMELGQQLHEISGMAWIPGRDVILAENDEKGRIITVDFKNHNDNVSEEKFGGKGDYEDIVFKNDTIYMLVSYGSIIRVTKNGDELNTEQYDLPEKGSNEFETLYLDEATNSLIMLCKECSKEKKTEIRTAYRFNLSTNSYDPAPAYTIDVNTVREMINDKEALFKPSAAAINPVDGKLYIVASVGKLLVIADKNTGKPEQVIKLDEALYNQPEGMTIAPNGDIYISNEGGTGIATILKFIRKK